MIHKSFVKFKNIFENKGEEEIKNRLLEDKVLKLLEDSAEITGVETEYEI